MSEHNTAFITGASRGVGRAIALRLAREGFNLFINCHTSIRQLAETAQAIEQIQQTSHPTCFCEMLTGDVGNPTDVSSLWKQIEDRTDHLSVLVNNAAISQVGLLSELSDADWNRMLASNLSSVFYCSRAAIPGMVRQKSGRILNISSMWGQAGASCEAAYSAAKSGVDGLTRALGKELAPSGIAVNALSLGVVDTSMNDQLSASEKRALAQDIPIGRFASCEEAADMAFQILRSPLYLTGQIIRMDGGFL